MRDTIAAIATPRGAGGIGIVRISGPDALRVLEAVFRPASGTASFRPWVLHHGVVHDGGGPLDDVLAVFMPGPRTFTGEDMAEIQCHGGVFLIQAVLEAVLRKGARPAARGEFSRRAYLNGRMDLSQAEAVAELVAAPSREAARYGLRRLEGALGRRVAALRERLDEARAGMCLAIDFPGDEVECLPPEAFAALVEEVSNGIVSLLAGHRRAALMEDGASVVLAGGVNAGKSSLLNALLGHSRALVTDIPGTTRDFLEEVVRVNGLPVRLADTAGLREGGGEVERLGMERSREKVAQADAVLILLDGGALGDAGAASAVCPDTAAAEALALAGDLPVLLVWNKMDLCRPACFPPVWAGDRPCAMISALTGEGVDELAEALHALLLRDAAAHPPEDGLAPNARQALELERALEEITALLGDIRVGRSYDCLSVRLDTAAAHLADVTGEDTPEEVLNRVFSSFCIGK